MWEIMTLTVVCGLSWIAVYLWGRAEGYKDGKKETEDMLGKELTALKSAYEGNILCETCSHEYKSDTLEGKPSTRGKKMAPRREKSNAAFKERRKLL